VTRNIIDQGKSGASFDKNSPAAYQIMRMKYKKLAKDNKRMKGSIKELKILLKDKEHELNENKKNIIRMELHGDKYSEEVDKLKKDKSYLEGELANLKSNAEELSSLVDIEKMKKHEKK